jgi:hypothetical protein
MAAAAKAAGLPVDGDDIYVGCVAQSIAVLGWQTEGAGAAALPRAVRHRELLAAAELGLKTVLDTGRVLPQQADVTSDEVEGGAVIGMTETAVMARVLRDAPERLTAAGAALARRFTSGDTGTLSASALARALLRLLAHGQRHHRACLSETRTGAALQPEEEEALEAALVALAGSGGGGSDGE